MTPSRAREIAELLAPSADAAAPGYYDKHGQEQSLPVVQEMFYQLRKKGNVVWFECSEDGFGKRPNQYEYRVAFVLAERA